MHAGPRIRVCVCLCVCAMEGHLFHVYSHVYTLNNLNTENMTVRCLDAHFGRIWKKKTHPAVTVIYFAFINVCAHYSVCGTGIYADVFVCFGSPLFPSMIKPILRSRCVS
ncbi:hypothetical protein XENOCAPTIV_028588 [Xenoophorus captivus]|uniref:Secreted protein n=1 Tax=Xenoophorus captivus TaxID=1517983 RepID=A0ABV0R6K7_9TELE